MHLFLLFSGTCSALNLVSYSKQMLMFHSQSFSSSDNIIHSVWGNCVFFYLFHSIFLSVFHFDVHCSAWTLILKHIRMSNIQEKKQREESFLWPGMGLRGIRGHKTLFWIVCLRVNTVVKVGGDMYKKKIKNYIFAHWDSRGVKSFKQRAEVSALSSVESVKMQHDG